MVQLVSLPASVEDISKECFYACESLSRVTFYESSSLKLIGHEVFCGCEMKEIPCGVKKLLRNAVPRSVLIARP